MSPPLPCSVMSFWLQAMSWTSCYRSVFILRESETCRGFGGFPGGTSDKESTCQCRRHKRLGFDPWVRKIPWRRAWQPTPAFLPGESHGQRSLAGYILEGCKKLDMTKVTCMHACACVHTHTHTHTHACAQRPPGSPAPPSGSRESPESQGSGGSGLEPSCLISRPVPSSFTCGHYFSTGPRL